MNDPRDVVSVGSGDATLADVDGPGRRVLDPALGDRHAIGFDEIRAALGDGHAFGPGRRHGRGGDLRRGHHREPALTGKFPREGIGEQPI